VVQLPYLAFSSQANGVKIGKYQPTLFDNGEMKIGRRGRENMSMEKKEARQMQILN
jgi:hypothetical protein